MIRTANPKLRMLAGPNGSGKSTLFRYLRTAHTFPLGYCLNPDEIEYELNRFRRLYLGGWGLHLRDAEIRSFVRKHGLARRITGELPKVEGKALVAPDAYRPGYFVSVFSDLLRREWMATEESFTFETVMSPPRPPRPAHRSARPRLPDVPLLRLHRERTGQRRSNRESRRARRPRRRLGKGQGALPAFIGAPTTRD
jgi:hypothetical protein